MFWRTLIFLLESALFVLLGLDLRAVVSDLSNVLSFARLAGAAAAVVGAIIVIRLVWELAVSPLIRFLPGQHSMFVVNPWRYRLVIGWGGMRGAITLAIALTLPTMVNGARFAERSVLILLAAVVVVVTLLGEGLTLAPLVRRLGLAKTEEHQRKEAVARARVTEAGLARLDELAEAGEVDEDTANVYRQLFELRLDRVRSLLSDDDDDPVDTSAFRRELVRAQRASSPALRQGQDQRRDPPDDRALPRPSGGPLPARLNQVRRAGTRPRPRGSGRGACGQSVASVARLSARTRPDSHPSRACGSCHRGRR